MKLKYNNFLGTSSDKFHSKYCTVSLVNYTKPVSEDWHSHENIHMSLILQGGNLESRKKEDIQVSEGKIMVYNEGELHRNRFTAFPSKNLNLELQKEFFSVNDLEFINLNLSLTKNSGAYLDFIKIYHELCINDYYTSDSIDLSLKSLFAMNNESSFMPSWIKRLREIIEDRWDEFISLSELALELNVHPVTISKYFKKYYNGTLGDYMRKIKVKKALHFLLYTDMSITEIAFTCGFSDHSHMIRVFRIYVGFNPKKIRQF
ncbi:helix-turn-helix domain-containing protein [Aquimarina macrocephali]|uniref:helix-turn-helix domain-containing protein n=1 Tax=Aquimarina macrocephali TaxID=666563 RepID=UPI000466F97B|nr:AraC family transcriptional regulator [Aquimarina macrocephali]